MRLVLLTMLLALGCSVHAEDASPYPELSAPELRSRIAAVDSSVREESWYQVEVLAFARQRPLSSEYWRLDRRPEVDSSQGISPGHQGPVSLPEQVDEQDRRAASRGAWQWLDEQALELDDMVERMQSGGEYRVLLHGAWRQPMRERGRAFPVLLSGGDALPPARTARGDAALPGDQASQLMRSLPTLNPSVEFSVPGSDDVTRLAPFSEPEFQASLRLHLGRYLHVEPDAWFGQDARDGQRFWVQIDQKRRMRGEELHYIDHPLFGLLLRLTPWQTPEQAELEKLEKALKALQG